MCATTRIAPIIAILKAKGMQIILLAQRKLKIVLCGLTTDRRYMENVEVIVNSQVGNIDLNFEEMKNFLTSQLEEYRTAVFNDDSIKSAKTCVAELRKQKDAFKKRITDVKKSYMKPFDDFKAKADELVGLYDEPIDFINGQVADFEERRKQEKKALIEQIYLDNIQGMGEFLPLDKIYNSKWENATYTKKQITQDITDLVESTTTAIDTIRNMNSEACEKAIEMYKLDFSLTNAISYVNRYEAQKAEILRKEQERKAQEEAERIRREEREKIEAERKHEEEIRHIREQHEAEIQQIVEETAQEVMESFIPESSKNDISSSFDYRLNMTNAEREKVEMFLDSIGVEWSIIGF